MSLREPERVGRLLGLWAPAQRALGQEPYRVWVPLNTVGPVTPDAKKGQSQVWVNGTAFPVLGPAEWVVRWLHTAHEDWLNEDILREDVNREGD